MTVLCRCLWSLAFCSLAGAEPNAPLLHGVVFADRNGNGLRDAGEPGLAGVGVSNGADVALTDAEGRYALPAGDGGRVFVIKPRGWRTPVDGQELPQYYRWLNVPAGGQAGSSRRSEAKTDGLAATPPAWPPMDFPLIPADEPDDFRALVFTDTQPASPAEVGYLERTIVDGLAGRTDFQFGVTLGDVSYDRPDLYPAINSAIARIGIPWHVVNGNHDLNLGAGDDRRSVATFESVYGPSTSAFYCGPALFIALNDVRFLGGPRYVGGLRPDQWTFLENLLRLTPREILVVTLMHIPLFSPDPSNAETFRAADRARLFALLRDRPHALLLSGHTHYQRHAFYGPADGWQGARPLEEANVAAACGGFWGGPPDAAGIPIATMADGTPHGYGILTVHGAEARLDYRPARHRAGDQIGLHVAATVAPRQGYVSYYANVFNGHDGWKVEARVDERGWAPLRRVLGWDPAYATLYLAQDTAATPPRNRRLPDPAICYHLWRAYLPPDLPRGQHSLAARATDPSGSTFTTRESFEVAEPAAP